MNDDGSNNNNVGIGYKALENNTTGGNNTSTGHASLNKNISGGNNTANGLNSLSSNTVGSSNSANGYSSLSNNTTGDYNTANGRDSGRYISDGTTNNSISNNSIYLGYSTKALANNQTNQIVIGYDATGIGSNSVVLGNDSIATTALKGNVGIGTTTPSEALDIVGKIALNDGGNSVFIGEGAGLNDDGTANLNVGVGINALKNNITGAGNNANGFSSLLSNTSGFQNTANGVQSLQNNTIGNQNSVNGAYSLQNNTTGGSNTANGYSSGRFISNGTTANTITSNSIYLGYNTKALANNQTNQIVIGYDATGVGSNSVVLGNDSIDVTALKGNVGIGTTTPSDLLHVKSGTGDSIVRIQSYGVNGNKSGVRFQNSSDNNNNAGGIYSERIGGIEHDIIIETWGNPSGTERLRVKNNGNVGIGTTAPTEALDVVGKIALNDGGNSVFIGEGAGLNDDGSNNQNVGIGVNSLQNNTTGNNNTASGVSALGSNTSGGNNCAHGLNSLLNNTYGFSNTANGVSSGRYISNGTTLNSVTNNSVYLGAQTKALANNQTNQIVIGYDATGNGSNSVVLGNDSITKTTLRGNVTTDGSVQVGDNTDTAIASNVGAMRYRTDAVASYADMAMETSAGVYAWVNIVTNTF